MQVSIIALTGFIFIMVFANSLGMLVAGQVLCGIPWGVFQTLTTAYASEVRIQSLRSWFSRLTIRSARSSFEVTWPPMLISAGVSVSFFRLGWSKPACLSLATGHGGSHSSFNGFGSPLFSPSYGSAPLLHGGSSARADWKKHNKPCDDSLTPTSSVRQSAPTPSR